MRDLDDLPIRDDAPNGFVWVWVPDPAWAPYPQSRGRCRYAVGPTGHTCRAAAVASFRRPRRTIHNHFGFTWWDYCGTHLYGRERVLIDGEPVVVHQVLEAAVTGRSTDA